MKNKNVVDSFNNAINGIIYAIKNERNMKFHIFAALMILFSSLIFRLTRIGFIIICLTIALVIICELFNTAVEVIVDIIVDVYHPKARVVKDVAAGAVLVSAFVSVVVGYIVFFDHVSFALEKGLAEIKRAPMDITITALVATIIVVLFMKAYFGKGTPFKGGMPSGHSAIAFSAATAIALWTDNVKITILSIVMALLLVQSRLEGKIHNLYELAAGAIVGFLTTLLLFQLFYL